MELTRVNAACAQSVPYRFKKMVNWEASVNALEKLKALDEERAKVLEEARKAALQKAQDAVRELNDLGLSYHLVESPEPPGRKAQQSARPPAEPAKAGPLSSGFDQTLMGS